METTNFKGFVVRSGTLDDYIVNEIASYRWLHLVAEDIVLDIGACIGTFSRYAVDKGVHLVVSVEPDPENFALLKRNSPNSIHVHAAVVHDGTGYVTLYKNTGKNKGLHSTVETRGRELLDVPARSFNSLLKLYKPTKIKIDCEGAEYTFLHPEDLPEHVQAVIIEYNLSRKHEQAAAQDMHTRFDGADWATLKAPRFGTKAWATLACYERTPWT